MMESGVIDLGRLNELKQEIGEEDFAEVAEIFLEEMDEILQGLKDQPGAATAADFHGLRGSASNLGFSAFVEACAIAERDAAQGAAIDIAPLDALYRASLEAASGVLPQAA